MSRPEDDYPDIEELPEEEWELEEDDGDYDELLLEDDEDDYDEEGYLDEIEDRYPDHPTPPYRPPARANRAPLIALAVLGLAMLAAWLQLRSDIASLQEQVALVAAGSMQRTSDEHAHAELAEQILIIQSLQDQINSLNTRVDNFASATADALLNPPATAAEEEPPETAAMPAAADPLPRGDWMINLASFPQRSQAERWVADFRHLDHPLEVVAVEGQQGPFFRVRVSGLESYDAARQLAAELSRQEGLSDPWISRR